MLPDWDFLQWLEAASYVVTIFGFPFALWIFLAEQRKERLSDDEGMYVQLSDDYGKFLTLVLQNSDLGLMSRSAEPAQFTAEQGERRDVLFEILIALFERAYILVYEEKMSHQSQRLWKTWEDYMKDWCVRSDFREQLPKLLTGEDTEFADYIRKLAAQAVPPEQDRTTSDRT